MYKYLNIRLVLLSLMTPTLFSCSPNPEDTRKHPLSEKALEYNFFQSLYPPFNSGDTLVFEYAALFCGQTKQEEIDRTYTPEPDTILSSNLLQQNFKGRFLDAVDLNKINTMDTVGDWQAKYDAYYRDKIRITFWGDIYSEDSVLMHERYTKGKNNYLVEKLFTFSNNTWTYKTQRSEINPKP